MRTLYESLFDIENNIDNIDYTVSSIGRLGVRYIIPRIFETKDFTDDKSIKNEFNIDVEPETIITEFCNCFEEKIMKRIGK